MNFRGIIESLKNNFKKNTSTYLSVLGGLFIFIIIALVIPRGDNDIEKKETKKFKEPEYLYGICIDSLDIEIDTIKKNQFLSNIMLKKNINYNVITHIEKNHRKTFDIRKIKPGQRHTFLIKRDSVATPLYWIYEINKADYAVFGLTDSLPAWVGHKEVTTKIETTEGTITTSLWDAIAADGGDPYLTLKLSDIYAWTVDFFGIQQGDSFKVYYENQYVEGESIGINKIIAAYLNNAGSEHYAYYFEQNGKGEYFDEDGANLRKAFLKAPLNYRRISSTFTNARKHPVTKIVRPHHGVDYAAAAGTVEGLQVISFQKVMVVQVVKNLMFFNLPASIFFAVLQVQCPV